MHVYICICHFPCLWYALTLYGFGNICPFPVCMYVCTERCRLKMLRNKRHSNLKCFKTHFPPQIRWGFVSRIIIEAFFDIFVGSRESGVWSSALRGSLMNGRVRPGYATRWYVRRRSVPLQISVNSCTYVMCVREAGDNVGADDLMWCACFDSSGGCTRYVRGLICMYLLPFFSAHV